MVTIAFFMYAYINLQCGTFTKDIRNRVLLIYKMPETTPAIVSAGQNE